MDGGPPAILLYNDDWGALPRTMPPCEIPCRLLRDPARLAEADAVIFHLPSLRAVPARKAPGQLWVAFSMESEAIYPRTADPAFLARFDLTISYRWDADIVSAYFGPRTMQRLYAAPGAKTATAPVALFLSNVLDRTRRLAYCTELMRHIEVHSYGTALRNRSLPADTGRATKREVLRAYKFTLALENSVARDYVTEKFFDPLLAGSVPVYLGAPNIDEFAPAPRSLIRVADFDDPAALAAHLRRLSEDEAAYADHLAWKQTGPVNRVLVARAEYGRVHPLCRLCLLLARRAITPRAAR